MMMASLADKNVQQAKFEEELNAHDGRERVVDALLAQRQRLDQEHHGERTSHRLPRTRR